MLRIFMLLGNLMIVVGCVSLGRGVWENVSNARISTEAFGTWDFVAHSAPRSLAGKVVLSGDSHGLEPVQSQPISQVIIPRLGIHQPVSRAPLEIGAGGGTWLVPDDHVGHAENSGDAGKPGNAVLFGHVSWRGFPGAFAELRRIQEHDVIDVETPTDRFRYVVRARRSVVPSDEAVLDETPAPVLTLITCDGPWLPQIWDYATRLVVRAVLEEAL